MKHTIRPPAAVKLALKLMLDHFKEHFIALYLRDGKVMKKSLISLGTSTASILDVSGVLRPALISRADSIILLHNHPSGVVLPSEADHEVTKKIKAAAKLINLELQDHIIFASNGSFFSFRENKKL